MTAPSLKHPGRWIWGLLLVPVLIGAARLQFNVEVLDLLPSDLRVVQGLKLFQQHFANARQLILTVQAPDPEEAEAATRRLAEALRTHTNLVSSVVWQSPWIEHPADAAEFIAYLWFNQPPEVFGQWTNRLSADQVRGSLDAAREELATSLSPDALARLSYDPLGLTRLPPELVSAMPNPTEGHNPFSSSDGRVRLLFVQANEDLQSYRACARWLSAVQTIADASLQTDSGSSTVNLGYTGRPAFVTEAALGMERDVTYSVSGTAAIIAVLFWLAHRRFKPMLWLLTLLGIILGCTLALGGLIFGTINVISMGFAAILLGLAVDYAVVHYQEALAHPEFSIAQVRHAIAPSILWAAVTTIAAFLMLNFGGLPGLGQLGTLVGLGVALSAGIMIFEFLPVLFPEREEAPAVVAPGAQGLILEEGGVAVRVSRRLAVSLLVVAVPLFILLTAGLPRVDPTANALRPQRSVAYSTLREVQTVLGQEREPWSLLIAGRNESEVGNRLIAVRAALNTARQRGILSTFTLPDALWPQSDHQSVNRAIARSLVTEGERIWQQAHAAGFADTSLGLLQGALKTWQSAAVSSGTYWPSNQMSRWILSKVAARGSTNVFALGVFHFPNGQATGTGGAELDVLLPKEQVWLSSWERLGSAIFSRVKANLWKVLVPMVGLVLLSLWLAFGRAGEILLSVATLLVSGLCLLAIMRLANWSWNLLNLMAVPLILGTGVDYSIFMQSALRRHHGHLGQAHYAVGRALWLCGGTAVAGFGSLAWSTSAGMASLGKVCAIGIGGNMLLAVFLLPVWWHVILGKRKTCPAQRLE